MTTLDIIILVVLGLGVLLGLLKGALKQLAGLLGLVVGLLAAKALYATVAEEVFSRVTDNMTVAQVLAFLAIWVVVPLLFWAVACLLTKAMDAFCLGWVTAGRRAGRRGPCPAGQHPDMRAGGGGHARRPHQPQPEAAVHPLLPHEAVGRTLLPRR